MKQNKTMNRLAAFFLALALLLTSCGGSKAKAATMHLRKTEGTVGVSDDKGKDVKARDDLGLYSGYGVDTRAESYAWIDLDNVKLTKLDQNSEIAITKEGKKLEVEVKSGSLFFNVTEPLASDETMNIRCSTIAIGIRGTCGWVEVPARGTMRVFLLEGKVRCETDDAHETIRAGEMAVMTKSGEITVSEFTARDIPDFVMEEVEDDDDLAKAILDASGIDVTDGGGGADSSLNDYQDALDELKQRGKILYTEIVDFEADGNPELLVLHTREDVNDELFAYSIFRKGPDGIADLYFGREPLYEGRGVISKFSLVESGGRMYLETYRLSKNGESAVNNSYAYDGSIAEKDGTKPSWSGDDADWTMLYWISETAYGRGTSYSILTDIEEAEHRWDDKEERYHDIRGKFSPVKVLAYGPGDGSLSILPDPSEIEDYLRPEPAPQPSGEQPGEPVNSAPVTPTVMAPAPSFVSWTDAGLEDHAMDWGDAVLEEVMRRTLSIRGRDIMLSDAWELTELKYTGDNGGRIRTISALSELKNLTTIELTGNSISSLDPLKGLTNLTRLSLSGNDIGGSLTPLSGLTNLTYLDLAADKIQNVSALSGLTNLTYLRLSYNRIEDVSPLSGLTNLATLDLQGNSITDYSPVEFVQDLKK